MTPCAHNLQNIYTELTGLECAPGRLETRDRTNNTNHNGTGSFEQLVQAIQGFVDGL